MAVYVDPAVWPLGRMKMAHLLADTEEELHAMAGKLGIHRRWFQHKSGKAPHYDVCKSNRAKAVGLGAIEVTLRDAATISKRLKAGQPPDLSVAVHDREQKAEQTTFL